MGRKKLAQKILETIDEREEHGMFIIIYDFKGGKNPKEFYYAIQELEKEGYMFTRIQKSVMLTNSKIGALAVKALAEHYKASVQVFKVCDVL